MIEPTMFVPQIVAPGITSLNSYIPVPGYGVLPVNAFVIEAQEPILVDTGLASLREQFITGLRSCIALEDLRWIWITHADPDHLGNLEAILREAPNARVVTTYLGMGKMSMHGLPLDRMYLLNPGQTLNIGDRNLLAVTPPTYDAPETTGIFDTKNNTLFSADCFGALLEEPVENAADISQHSLRDGCLAWSSVDSPWLSIINPAKYNEKLSEIKNLGVNTILSSHLPVAKAMTDQLLEIVADACKAPPFTGPDQQALEKMLAA